MKPLVSVSAALMLAGTAGVANAQVTQTYSYDTNGRLTGVSTTGSGGTNTAAYVYDDADNRTSRSQTGTTAYAALSRLPVGDDLQPHQALVSPDGRFSLAVRETGALELWSGRSVVWSSLGEGIGGGGFTLDGAGRARFRGPEPEEDRLAGSWLALGDDGDLSLFDGAGSVLPWRWARSSGGRAAQ